MQITIKVAPGKRVRDPFNGGRVMPEGKDFAVEKNGFWERRLVDGDVVLVNNAKDKQATPAPKPAEPASKTKTGEK